MGMSASRTLNGVMVPSYNNRVRPSSGTSPEIEEKSMGKSVEQLYREAEELDEAGRARLAGLLLESIEPDPDVDVEEAWSKEIESRLKSIDEGRATLVPWEDVKRRVHEKMAERFGS